MKIQTALLVALLPALLTVAAAAQRDVSMGAQTQRAKNHPKTAFVLEAGETSIQELIDRSATFLDRNILTHPQECAQALPIRLQQSIKTDRAGCENLLTGLLYRSGFALTVVDEQLGIYEAIMLNGVRGREVMNRAQQKTAADILRGANLQVPVSTVIQLKHVNAQIANNALRPFFSSNTGGPTGMLTIGTAGSASALLVSGMQTHVARAIRLIQACDVPQPAKVYRGKDLPGYVQKLEERIATLEKLLATKTKNSIIK